jgi:predicted GNAT family acetyltransferase
MIEVRFEPTNTELFAFNLYYNRHKIGEMLVGIAERELKVYHTFLIEEYRGKGYRRLMLDGVIAYSHSENLRLFSLCTYATAQLRLYPDLLPVEFVRLKLAR